MIQTRSQQGRRTPRFLGGFKSCFLLAGFLVLLCGGTFTVFLAAWDWSLTSVQMIVFVNDADAIDTSECTWSGSQQFRVTNPDVEARFRVLAFETGPKLVALINVRDAVAILPTSVELRLLNKHIDGIQQQIAMTPIKISPLTKISPKGHVQSWSQDFRLLEDLRELPDRGLYLQWKMKYQDGHGEIRDLSITIPLRKEEITIPSSIVRTQGAAVPETRELSVRFARLKSPTDHGVPVRRWSILFRVAS